MSLVLVIESEGPRFSIHLESLPGSAPPSDGQQFELLARIGEAFVSPTGDTSGARPDRTDDIEARLQAALANRLEAPTVPAVLKVARTLISAAQQDCDISARQALLREALCSLRAFELGH